MASTAKQKADELLVDVEETGAIQRDVRVTVPEKRVKRAFEKAYRQLGRQVVVKGFRPGKAPRSVLEKLYGPSVAEDVERTVVSETLPDAFELAEVEPVSEPSIDAALPENGKPLVYTASVEVKPAISLPELTGLAASRPAVSIDEDAVDTEINHLRERRAPLGRSTGGHGRGDRALPDDRLRRPDRRGSVRRREWAGRDPRARKQPFHPRFRGAA